MKNPLGNFEEVTVIPASDAHTVQRPSWSEDGRYILTNGRTPNTARVWKADTGELVDTLESTESLRDVQFFGPLRHRRVIGISGNDKIVAWQPRETIANKHQIRWIPDEKPAFQLSPISGIDTPYIKSIVTDDVTPRINRGTPSRKCSIVIVQNGKASDSTNQPPTAIFVPGDQPKVFHEPIRSVKWLGQCEFGVIHEKGIWYKRLGYNCAEHDIEYNTPNTEDMTMIWCEYALNLKRKRFDIRFLITANGHSIPYDTKVLITADRNSINYLSYRDLGEEEQIKPLPKSSIPSGGFVLAGLPHEQFMGIASKSEILVTDMKRDKTMSVSGPSCGGVTSLEWGWAQGPIKQGHYRKRLLASARENGTVQVWDVEQAMSRNERYGKKVGRFGDCYLGITPFVWNPTYDYDEHYGYSDTKTDIACVDVNGDIHVYKMTYDN